MSCYDPLQAFLETSIDNALMNLEIESQHLAEYVRTVGHSRTYGRITKPTCLSTL